MPQRLPVECLNEVFEYLEEDKVALHSCLLVNRRWGEVSVRILWRNIWNFKYYVAYKHRSKVGSAILSTIIACLPNESKEYLYKNEIFITTPTSKPPLFNYAAFCKVLPIHEICQISNEVFKNDLTITSSSLKDKTCLVAKEIFKLFMGQISSLKNLIYYSCIHILNNIPFINFPGARDCLTDLSELRCSSNIHSDFFHQLSQICHNLQSLTIEFNNEVSNDLKELISLQNNLKNLNLLVYEGNNWTDIIPSLTKHSNTLTKLNLSSDNDNLSLSFVALFLNLQEIILDGINLEDFKGLQHVTFPKLQILKILYPWSKPDFAIKFLENNGKNLKEFYTDEENDALNLSIAKFCPNLKKFFVILNNDKLETLKNMFNSCKYLETLKIRCGKRFLSVKETLEVVVEYSSKNFHELKIYNDSRRLELLSEDLESFFVSWKNRIPKKSLSLIIIIDYNDKSLVTNEENMEIINKYKNLGIIKKFEVKWPEEEEDDEGIY